MDINGEFISLVTRHKFITQASDLSDMCLQTWEPSRDMALGVSAQDLVLGRAELLCCPGQLDTLVRTPAMMRFSAGLPISDSNACRCTCGVDLPVWGRGLTGTSVEAE